MKVKDEKKVLKLISSNVQVKTFDVLHCPFEEKLPDDIFIKCRIEVRAKEYIQSSTVSASEILEKYIKDVADLYDFKVIFNAQKNIFWLMKKEDPK